MSFDLWFPTPILYEEIKEWPTINASISSRIDEIRSTVPSGGRTWLGRPYNTCGTFNIVDDAAFFELVNQVTSMVHLYASRLGVDINRNKFKCGEAWLNIYQQNDFQEFHHHAGHHFSAVYYVKVPQNSSNIIFETPLAPDMKPLPISLHSFISDTRANYAAQEGKVIIFRSNIKHCVPSHTGNEERISIAFNFD
jgi:uncharacterized protein (TIGR02466 family)